jgi:Fic-DOC domain mobile mystery protein B
VTIGSGDSDGATPLDPNELAGLRLSHVATRGELDRVEQANLQQGLLWLRRRRRRTDVLHEGFVRELHRRLFGEVWSWAGTWRTTERYIGVDQHQIATQLQQLLGDARYWIVQRTYGPREIALRLHHRLVAIHLFANGNGRHARIFADVVLAECCARGPLSWHGGGASQTATERRAAYIDALRKADGGDYESAGTR